jgi:anthranilate phosphoribosyltransferase
MSGGWQSSLLKDLMAGRHLTVGQAHSLFNQIMDGELTESQIAAVLVALAAKGETVEEITGAALAMRDHARKIDPGDRAVIDTCGTGGTGLSTFNISTTAALVAAGAGACVAKHGNRTSTRASGSADVLAELGVNIEADEACLVRCLRQANVCFCFAVRHHPAMRFAAPVRKALAVRTIFNLLGPLTNPAGASRQLMGVFDRALVDTVAAVLVNLGSRRFMVVHAEAGLAEISTMGKTFIAQLGPNGLSRLELQPEDLGLKRARLEDLGIKTVAQSARAVRDVLGGKNGPHRDIVLLNAAAALVVAEKAGDLPAGLELARTAIDSGAAAATLEKLIAASHGR